MAIIKAFEHIGIKDFQSATEYIKLLPYKRNIDKYDQLCVIKEKGGTCSTKHALLKRYAEEIQLHQLKLILGIFKMNAKNSPKIIPLLNYYQLNEIPEAHNYFKIKNKILDYTKNNFGEENFAPYLLEEIEISAEQTLDFKVNYHKNYLKNYLEKNKKIPYTLEEFWAIREKCIATL